MVRRRARAHIASVSSFVALVALALPGSASAQLAGSYSIAPSGDYASVGAAIADLYAQGVAGAVQFEIAPGTWVENGGADLVIDLHDTIPGISEANRVTFAAAPGASAETVIFDRATVDAGSTAQVALVRSSYVTLRDLTLRISDPDPAAGTATAVVEIGAASSSTRLYGFHLEACRIENLGNRRRRGVYSVRRLEDSVISGNDFSDLSDGILLTQPSYTTLIEDNDFARLTWYQSGAFIGYGISVNRPGDLVVRGNRLGTPEGWATNAAIHVLGDDLVGEGALIEGNVIHHLTSLGGTFGGYGIRVTNARATIVDNMISGTMTTRIMNGIYVDSSRPVEVLHNSVRVDSSAGGAVLRVFGAGPHRIENNVLVDSDGLDDVLAITSSAAQMQTYTIGSNLLYTESPSPFANLVSSPLGDFTTIAAWRDTDSGQFGAGSVSVRPEFEDPEDLHLAVCGAVDPALIGKPLVDPEAATDIDGEPREPLIAKMGADQVSGASTDLFAPAEEHFVGSIAIDLAAADLDGDTDVDLAVARLDSAGPGSISLFDNPGDAQFPVASTLGVGGTTASPALLRAGDIDDDGNVDFAVVMDGTQPSDPTNDLYIYWGLPGLSFENPLPAMARPDLVSPPAPFPELVHDLELVDFDASGGRLDILVLDIGIVGGIQPGAIHQLFNSDDRAFNWFGAAASLPSNPNDLVVGDLDDDGDPEALTGPDAGFDTLLDGLLMTVVAPAPATDPKESWALEPAAHLVRLDADASPDLVYDVAEDPLGETGTDVLKWQRGNGGLGFDFPPTEIPILSAGPERRPGPFVPFDWDGDGDLDLFVGNRGSGSNFDRPGQGALLLNDGQAGFSERAICNDIGLARAPRKLVAADFDGDGREDIATIMQSWPSVAILRNRSLGGAPAQSVEGFAGVFDGSDVTLAWSTPSEQTNAGFGVERRDDPLLPWVPLGVVPSTGASSTPSLYDYVDPAVSPTPSGSVEYRLRQVDLDGGAPNYVGPIAVAVPEPTPTAALLIAIALLTMLARRREKQHRTRLFPTCALPGIIEIARPGTRATNDRWRIASSSSEESSFPQRNASCRRRTSRCWPERCSRFLPQGRSTRRSGPFASDPQVRASDPATARRSPPLPRYVGPARIAPGGPRSGSRRARHVAPAAH